MTVKSNIKDEKACTHLEVVNVESGNMLEPFSEETSFLLVNALREHDIFKAKSLSIAGGKVIR
ncbi:MAG: hypothetical protein A2271_04370 [Candidatus Moranbacteria bacterium RIFOXYA12_FULL_35_19]|nr:MAG: hypothetical protein UR78_C0001G0003 [Candidatus Moranbacteria bacterium GW2011_GWF2_35_39]OGI31736.1 MAG: hypothetical protein A2343_04380 [Candidatus Moranbacteria bacterium RIFOXYB12_FULL_35_8]OGI35676.1 MAG: hypothetical protein A2271_04370 [Candidatus Moranbacteria bacterium RIFOXYA12_FULL_35_19]